MNEPTRTNDTYRTPTGAGQESERSRPPGEAYLVSLREAEAAGRDLVGGKAATLSRLMAAGFPVPDGVVLTTDAARAAMREDDTISSERELGRPLPSEVSDALVEELRALGNGPVAVRSSGVGEDAATASYAGQYESVLNVRGADALVEAVRHCWASARAARVDAYRAAHGEQGPAPIAVLIQRMVPAEAAGVAFTADPITGDRDAVVVHAVRGTGERLVAGEVTPDAWNVRHGEVEARHHEDGALDQALVRRVADLAARIEEHAGSPQDVEWAISGDRVHLLQARPITLLPTPPEIEPPPGPWMKDAVHYTGPLSPLAATAYLPRLERGGTRMCDLGLLIEAVQQRTIGWEVYAQPVPPSTDDVVGERIAAAIDLVRHDRPSELVHRWRTEWRDRFAARIEDLRTRNLTALDDETLDAHMGACLDLLEEGQEVHFQLFVPYMLAAYDLVTTCRELLDWELSTALDLVSGLSDASAAPTMDLVDIAAQIRERPDARDLVADAPIAPGDEAMTEAIRRTAPEVAERIRAHQERFGCRVPAYDAGEPTYAERPELTLRLLRDLVAGVHDPDETRKELARTRERTAERARRELAERDASQEERDRFERVLDRARDRWGLREENLLYTDAMPNGLIRLAALEIGRRLMRRGRLRRSEDAPWLQLEELRAALRERDAAPATNLLPLVDRRRREHAWVRAHPGPPLYGNPPPGPPPLTDLPAEARYVNEAMNWLMGVEYGPPVEADAGEAELQGLPGSPGRTTGTVRIVRDASEFERLRPGDVLVCRLTTPDWTALFARASAVVTDTGSPLSHAAIVAREHGIPAVVGTRRATELLRDGERVRLDGTAGTVVRLDG